jgi:DNA modification methylase
MEYPQDWLNHVLCGDSVSLVQQLPDGVLDAVVIDPPYGEGMGYQGDESTFQAEQLLLSFLHGVESKIKQNGHIGVFWTMRDLDVCLDVLRSAGFYYRRTLSMYLPRGSARPYLGWLPRTQAIVIGQKYLPYRSADFHRDLALYLEQAIQNSRMSKAEVARRLGCDSRLVMKWTRVNDPAWCLITPRFYRPLKEMLGLGDDYDVLLTRHPGNVNRTDFDYHHDTYVVDDTNLQTLHPSQKPLTVVEHLVTCLTPAGGVVLDGFAGSGTTAVACQRTNRQFICVEIDPDRCVAARHRLLRSFQESGNNMEKTA